MSWIVETLTPIEARLLLWFLDSGAKYVEATGLKFEWVDGYLIVSSPRFESNGLIHRIARSQTFRQSLEQFVGESECT